MSKAEILAETAARLLKIGDIEAAAKHLEEALKLAEEEDENRNT